MRCNYSCRTEQHLISRRSFLGATAAGLGLAGFTRPAASGMLAGQGRQILVVWLAGGASQLETWDPKPRTRNGGPFRAIETSIPGVRICELLPHTARQMHHMCLVRGVNTHEDDHGKGQYKMLTGRDQNPGAEHPQIGAVAARFLAKGDEPLPGYIHITPGGGGTGSSEAAYLGPRYAPLYLGNGQAPANTTRYANAPAEADLARHDLRRHANDRFARRRRTAETEAYTTTYEQALQLMERREVFDVTKEPERELERYGRHDFGRHCLLARRILEAGATYVQVTHSNYDTHNENFTFHLEQLGEFDQGFSTLLDDLHQRGRLERTLVIVMSEFGRTPTVNPWYGRDHWSKAWSVALAGCGVKAGAVVGKTNKDGTEVTDREVGAGHLFHTYLSAVGLDPTADLEIDGRAIQITDPAASAIQEVLSVSPLAEESLDFAAAHVARDITHNHPLVVVRYHPGGKLVFASNENFELLRYDLGQPDDKVKAILPEAHESWIAAIGLTPDGATLCSGGMDGRLVIWADPAGKPRPSRTIQAHAGWLNSLAVSADGRHVATAGNDRMVRIWSVVDGTLEAELPGHERPIYRVSFVPGTGDRFLVSADLLGRVVQWELATRKEVRRLDAAKLYKYEAGQGVDYGGVRDLAFAPDGGRLACSGLIEASNPLGAVSIPAVLELDWAEGKELVLARPKESVNGVGWGVRWHPAGTILMVSGGTGGGFLWAFEPGKPNELAKIALPNTARDLDLAPDGRQVAVAHHDGHLRLVALHKKPA